MNSPQPPPGTTVGEAGERALLRWLRERIPAGPGVVVGPGDDAAVLRTAAETVVTTDTLVEDVHFRRAWSTPRRVGRKALNVNLSDVAAMGGRARYATVSLCLPPALELSWLRAFYDGLLERAGEASVALVGGNLSSIDGPVVIDVAVLGETERPLRRSGARPGDLVVVTGTPGTASVGLALLEAGMRLAEDGRLEVPPRAPALSQADEVALRACLRAHLDPAPPLAFGAALAGLEAVAAGMDVSDGLSGDLLALCEASGVAAMIEADRVPRPADLRAWGSGDPLEHALHGGEDYGLLLALRPDAEEDLTRLARGQGVAATVAGVFEAGPPRVWLREAEGRRPLPPRAHQHFGSGGA